MVSWIVVKFGNLLYQLPDREGFLSTLVDHDWLEPIEDQLVLIPRVVVLHWLVIVHHELPGERVPVDGAPVVRKHFKLKGSLSFTRDVESVWERLMS